MNEKRASLLVVSENIEDIAILARILGRDCDVQAAMDAKQALYFAQGKAPPDLFLVCITPGDLLAFEFWRGVRQEIALSLIPLVFLTTKALAADERMAFEIGAVDYIRQPVDPEVLRARIRVHLFGLKASSGPAESRYERVFRASKHGIAFIDVQTGRILDINSAMAEKLDAPRESLIGKPVSELPPLKRLLPSRRGSNEGRLGEYIRHIEPAAALDGPGHYLKIRYDLQRGNGRTVMRLDIRDMANLPDMKRFTENRLRALKSNLTQ